MYVYTIIMFRGYKRENDITILGTYLHERSAINFVEQNYKIPIEELQLKSYIKESPTGEIVYLQDYEQDYGIAVLKCIVSENNYIRHLWTRLWNICT